MNEFEVQMLHERPELVTRTAELINREWSRSIGARESSIEDSCEDLPCSFVLTSHPAGDVVGYTRLTRVAGRSDGVLMETVVVSPDLRGRGLGRKLIEAAEQHALKRGYRRMHLSTHDKQELYSHLGYSSGPVVSPFKRCMEHLYQQQTEALLTGLGGSSRDTLHQGPQLMPSPSVHVPTPPCPPSVPTPPCPPSVPTLPPPPPPPPRLLESSQNPTEITTWMMKELV